jgi:excisionase family DNA binding protein
VADRQVLSVHEAADCLGVSMERVRQMVHAGQLAGWRSSAGWLISAESVAGRSRNVYTGRPPAPQTAWSAIAVLAAAMAHASKSEPDEAASIAELIPDRKARHRILRLLASLPDPVADAGPWRRLLSARGQVRRLWGHPGVLGRLAGDPRVARGGAEAALAGHDGLTARPGRLELYASESDAEDIIHQYRMRDDADGQVHLVVVPASVPPRLAPGWGALVSTPAAASDLLEEDDPRARYAAAVDLQSCLDALRAAGWLDRANAGLPRERERSGEAPVGG